MSGLILLRPIFSEKAQNAAAHGHYTFEVVKHANKSQIKKAVTDQFGVKIAQVRTMNFAPEMKRIGKHFGKTRSFKKAVVKLAEGSIDLWVPPASAKATAGKPEKKETQEKKEKK